MEETSNLDIKPDVDSKLHLEEKPNLKTLNGQAASENLEGAGTSSCSNGCQLKPDDSSISTRSKVSMLAEVIKELKEEIEDIDGDNDNDNNDDDSSKVGGGLQRVEIVSVEGNFAEPEAIDLETEIKEEKPEFQDLAMEDPQCIIDLREEIETYGLKVERLTATDGGDASDDEGQNTASAPRVTRQSHSLRESIYLQEARQLRSGKTIVDPRGSKELGKDVTSPAVSKLKVQKPKQHCFFCNASVVDISTHLEKHSMEPEIAKLSRLGHSLSEQRNYLSGIQKIKSLGNFLYNVKLLQTGKSILVLRDGSSLPQLISSCLPCVFCYKFYGLKELGTHLKEHGERGLDLNQIKSLGRALLDSACISGGEEEEKLAAEVKKFVVGSWAKTEVRRLVQKDRLILQFGSVLHRKFKKWKVPDISGKMKQLGQLLLILQKASCTDKSLDSFLTGNDFEDVLATVKLLEEKNPTAHGKNEHLKNPAPSLKLGFLLAEVANVKKGHALQTGNRQALWDAEEFLERLIGDPKAVHSTEGEVDRAGSTSANPKPTEVSHDRAEATSVNTKLRKLVLDRLSSTPTNTKSTRALRERALPTSSILKPIEGVPASTLSSIKPVRVVLNRLVSTPANTKPTRVVLQGAVSTSKNINSTEEMHDRALSTPTNTKSLELVSASTPKNTNKPMEVLAHRPLSILTDTKHMKSIKVVLKRAVFTPKTTKPTGLVPDKAVSIPTNAKPMKSIKVVLNRPVSEHTNTKLTEVLQARAVSATSFTKPMEVVHERPLSTRTEVLQGAESTTKRSNPTEVVAVSIYRNTKPTEDTVSTAETDSVIPRRAVSTLANTKSTEIIPDLAVSATKNTKPTEDIVSTTEIDSLHCDEPILYRSETEASALSDGSSEDETPEASDTKTASGKRVKKLNPSSTTKYFCLLCKLRTFNLQKHFYSKHSHKPEILQLLQQAKSDGKAFDKGIRRLGFVGNFLHNVRVLQGKARKLVASKKLSEAKDISYYLPCFHCYDFYAEQDLIGHIPKCEYSTGSEHKKFGSNLLFCRMLVEGASLHEERDENGFAKLSERVSKYVRRGEVLEVVSQDKLILRLGVALWKRTRKRWRDVTASLKGVSTKMSQLGRLLIHLRGASESISPLEMFISRESFEAVVQAVDQMFIKSSLASAKESLTTPKLSLKVAQVLGMVANLKRGWALMSGNKKDLEDAERFLECLQSKEAGDLIIPPQPRETEKDTVESLDGEQGMALRDKSQRKDGSLDKELSIMQCRVRSANFCFFCEKSILGIQEHFITKHSHELEVAHLLSLMRSKETYDQYLQERHRLRSLGNFLYNVKALQRSEELSLRVSRGFSSGSRSNYLPCLYCLNFVDTTDSKLAQHFKFCASRKNSFNTDRITAVVFQNLALNRVLLESASLSEKEERELRSQLRKLVSPKVAEQDASLAEVMERDDLIMRCGALMMNKHLHPEPTTDSLNELSIKMTQLAKLLSILLKTSASQLQKSLTHFMTGEGCGEVIKAAAKLTEQETPTDSHNVGGEEATSTPLLPVTVGVLLAAVANVKRGQALISRNNKDLNDAESFFRSLHGKNVISWVVTEDQEGRTESDDDNSLPCPNLSQNAGSGESADMKETRWNKKSVCLYCRMGTASMQRHLVKKHPQEPEVQEFLALKQSPTTYQDYRRTFDKLRNTGNFLHNVRVRQGKASNFKPCRYQDGASFSSNLPCLHCLLFVKKSKVTNHLVYCSLRQGRHCQKLNWNQILNRVLLESACLSDCDTVGEISAEDLVLPELVRKDELVMCYRASLLKIGEEKYERQIIQQFASLGKLLLQLGTSLPQHPKSLSSFITGDCFDEVIKSAAKVTTPVPASINVGWGDASTPSQLNLTMGRMLATVATVKRGRALQSRNSQDLKDADDFLDKLLQLNFTKPPYYYPKYHNKDASTSLQFRLDSSFLPGGRRSLSKSQNAKASLKRAKFLSLSGISSRECESEGDATSACSGQEEKSVSVDSGRKTRAGLRKKSDYCMVCEAPSNSIIKHLIKTHPKTPEVSHLRRLLKSESRNERDSFENEAHKLTCIGNFLHNVKVLNEGGSDIVAVKKSTSNLPCLCCYGFFGQTHLLTHMETCKLCDGEEHKKIGDAFWLSRILLESARLSSRDEKWAQEVKESVSEHVLDETLRAVFDVVAKDELVLYLGALLYRTSRESRREEISKDILQLGALLKDLQNDSEPDPEPDSSEVRDLSSFVTESSFETIVKVAQKHNALPLSLKMGFLLAAAGNAKRGRALQSGHRQDLRDAEGFLRALHCKESGPLFAIVSCRRKTARMKTAGSGQGETGDETDFNDTQDEQSDEDYPVIKQKRVKRKNTCLFCRCSVTLITRHYSRRHKTEPAIALFISLRKDPSRRAEYFCISHRLRIFGNFLHNVKVLRGEATGLSVSRVSSSAGDLSADDALPCIFCFQLMQGDVSKHFVACPLRNFRDHKRFNHHNELSRVLRESVCCSLDDEGLWLELKESVLPHMSDEHQRVFEVLEKDVLAKQCGVVLFKRSDKENVIQLPHRLELLGKLLTNLQKSTELQKTLTNFISGDCFEIVMEVAGKLSEPLSADDVDGETLKSPPVVNFEMGHLLAIVGNVKRGWAIQCESNQDFQEAELFLLQLQLEEKPHSAFDVTQHTKTVCNLPLNVVNTVFTVKGTDLEIVTKKVELEPVIDSDEPLSSDSEETGSDPEVEFVGTLGEEEKRSEKSVTDSSIDKESLTRTGKEKKVDSQVVSGNSQGPVSCVTPAGNDKNATQSSGKRLVRNVKPGNDKTSVTQGRDKRLVSVVKPNNENRLVSIDTQGNDRTPVTPGKPVNDKRLVSLLTPNNEKTSVSVVKAGNDKRRLVSVTKPSKPNNGKTLVSLGTPVNGNRLVSIVAPQSDKRLDSVATSGSDKGLTSDHDPGLPSKMAPRNVNKGKTEPSPSDCKKRNFCFVCRASFINLSLHMFRAHKHNSRVSNLMKLNHSDHDAFVKESQRLRCLGNFFYNIEVFQGRTSNFLAMRGVLPHTKISGYLPCLFCLGLYSIPFLTMHMGECPLKREATGACEQRKFNRKHLFSRFLIEGASLTKDKKWSASTKEKLLNTLVSRGKESAVLSADRLLLRFTAGLIKFTELIPYDPAQLLYLLYKLVTSLRKKFPEIKTLADCISDCAFYDILEAAEKVARAQTSLDGEQLFERPSHMRELGFSMALIGNIMRGWALRRDYPKRQEDAEKFLSRIQEEWPDPPMDSSDGFAVEKRVSNRQEKVNSLRKGTLHAVPPTSETTTAAVASSNKEMNDGGAGTHSNKQVTNYHSPGSESAIRRESTEAPAVISSSNRSGSGQYRPLNPANKTSEDLSSPGPGTLQDFVVVGTKTLPSIEISQADAPSPNRGVADSTPLTQSTASEPPTADTARDVFSTVSGTENSVAIYSASASVDSSTSSSGIPEGSSSPISSLASAKDISKDNPGLVASGSIISSFEILHDVSLNDIANTCTELRNKEDNGDSPTDGANLMPSAQDTVTTSASLSANCTPESSTVVSNSSASRNEFEILPAVDPRAYPDSKVGPKAISDRKRKRKADDRPECDSALSEPAGKRTKSQTRHAGHYCLFCCRNDSKLKLSNHLIHYHSREPEVKELLGLKLSASTHDKFVQRVYRLRCLGNFQHNLKILQGRGTGDFAVMRTGREVRPLSDFLPCLYCYGFYPSGNLESHMERCTLRDEGESNHYYGRLSFSKYLLASACLTSKDGDWTKDMKDSVLPLVAADICKFVENDRLALRCGALLLKFLEGDHFNLVAQKMEKLGILIRDLRKETSAGKSARNLQNFINGPSVPDVVKVCEKLCGLVTLESGRHTFQDLSFAKGLGFLLALVGNARRGWALQCRYKQGQLEAETFLTRLLSDPSPVLSLRANLGRVRAEKVLLEGQVDSAKASLSKKSVSMASSSDSVSTGSKPDTLSTGAASGIVLGAVTDGKSNGDCQNIASASSNTAQDIDSAGGVRKSLFTEVPTESVSTCPKTDSTPSNTSEDSAPTGSITDSNTKCADADSTSMSANTDFVSSDTAKNTAGEGAVTESDSTGANTYTTSTNTKAYSTSLAANTDTTSITTMTDSISTDALTESAFTGAAETDSAKAGSSKKSVPIALRSGSVSIGAKTDIMGAKTDSMGAKTDTILTAAESLPINATTTIASESRIGIASSDEPIDIESILATIDRLEAASNEMTDSHTPPSSSTKDTLPIAETTNTQSLDPLSHQTTSQSESAKSAASNGPHCHEKTTIEDSGALDLVQLMNLVTSGASLDNVYACETGGNVESASSSADITCSNDRPEKAVPSIVPEDDGPAFVGGSSHVTTNANLIGSDHAVGIEGGDGNGPAFVGGSSHVTANANLIGSDHAVGIEGGDGNGPAFVGGSSHVTANANLIGSDHAVGIEGGDGNGPAFVGGSSHVTANANLIGSDHAVGIEGGDGNGPAFVGGSSHVTANANLIGSDHAVGIEGGDGNGPAFVGGSSHVTTNANLIGSDHAVGIEGGDGMGKDGQPSSSHSNSKARDHGASSLKMQKMVFPVRGRGKNFCCFCKTQIWCFPRHLFRAHSNEPEVRHLSTLKESDPKAYSNGIARLRRKGNFLYTIETLQAGETNIKLIRQASNRVKLLSSLLPCLFCYGIYAKVQLSMHSRSCREGEVEGSFFKSHLLNRILMETATLNDMDERWESELREFVLPLISTSGVAHIVETDRLIFRFGEAHLKISGRLKAEIVADRMRRLAKLLLILEKTDPTRSGLEAFLTPENFDLVKKAAEQLHELKNSTRGHCLQDTVVGRRTILLLGLITTAKQGLAFQSERKRDVADAENFFACLEREWSGITNLPLVKQRSYQRRKSRHKSEQREEVNSTVTRNQSSRRFPRSMGDNPDLSDYHDDDGDPDYLPDQNPTYCRKRKRGMSTSDSSGDEGHDQGRAKGKVAGRSEVIPRKRWTEEELSVVKEVFGEFLKGDLYPTGFALKEAVEQNPCLKGRTVAQMRSKLQHLKRDMLQHLSLKKKTK